jgi:hypothetical protein
MSDSIDPLNADVPSPLFYRFGCFKDLLYTTDIPLQFHACFTILMRSSFWGGIQIYY